MKFGAGDYELSDEQARNHGVQRDSTIWLQGLFFLAVILMHPASTVTLAQMASELPRTVPKPWRDARGFLRATNTLRPTVRSWCLNLNLREPWFEKWALFFVCARRWREEAGDNIGSIFEGADYLFEAARKRWPRLADASVPLQAPKKWDPQFETKQQYLERCETSLHDQLEQSCKERAIETAALGFDKVPVKRGIDVFFWLAAHQTLGYSTTKIAAVEDRDRTTVGDRIAELATKIGLDIRSSDEYDRNQDDDQIRRVLRAAQEPLKKIEFDFDKHLPPFFASKIPRGFKDLFS